MRCSACRWEARSSQWGAGGGFVAGIAAGRAASVYGEGGPPLCERHAGLLAALDTVTRDITALVVAVFPGSGEPS